MNKNLLEINNMDIDKLLNENIDLNYKKFHEKICHTQYNILGIKIPVLRKIAKELLKTYSYEEIVNNLNNNYYEHVMLEGLIIANANIIYEEKLILIKNFIPKIDNWAICDVFCAELKFIKNKQDQFFNFLLPYFNSNKEYHLRFSIVILLNYYINDKYIDYVLNKMLDYKSDYYYVNMAISWCISFCLIKYFDKTKDFLIKNRNNINKWIFNKSIQKAKESYRISKDNKEILNNLKIK